MQSRQRTENGLNPFKIIQGILYYSAWTGYLISLVFKSCFPKILSQDIISSVSKNIKVGVAYLNLSDACFPKLQFDMCPKCNQRLVCVKVEVREEGWRLRLSSKDNGRELSSLCMYVRVNAGVCCSSSKRVAALPKHWPQLWPFWPGPKPTNNK